MNDSSWAIDPAKTLVICFEYGGRDAEGKRRRLVLDPFSIRWIKEHFPNENVLTVNRWPYLVARNGTIHDYVLPLARERGLTWLLSIDNDVTITHPGVDLFLSAPGDVVACRCRMPAEHAWDERTSFHTPFYRAPIEVFRVVRAPWFRFVYNQHHTKLLKCDCQYFAEKCRKAGFTTGHSGTCSHGSFGSAWWPNCHDAAPGNGTPFTLCPYPETVQRMIQAGRLV